MIMCNGKTQTERGFGEPTGFIDSNNASIRVGDRMSIRHDCNCDRCKHYEDVEIVWNQEWKAYGMLTRDGRWVSGMGIASGYSVTPNKGMNNE